MKQYTFIHDPGHGWLEVPQEDAKGIRFSKYSPRRNGNIYLEEDCDAPKFLEIMKARGVEIEIVDKYVEIGWRG